jgi:hypothetical protein
MRPRLPIVALLLALVAVAGHTLYAGQSPPQSRNPAGEASEARRPKDDADLRFWLQNMVWHHRFTSDEVRAATGLTAREVADALRRFGITPATRPKRPTPSPAFCPLALSLVRRGSLWARCSNAGPAPHTSAARLNRNHAVALGRAEQGAQ